LNEFSLSVPATDSVSKEHSVRKPIDDLLQGHVLDLLRGLPSDYVDVVVTSPPYWGLRSYGEDCVAVWDGKEGCEHQWQEEEQQFHSGTNAGEKQLTDKGTFHNDFSSKHDFCVLCGAWKGQLGLEPHPSLYIQHIAQVFGEVRRVLKPSGSLWLDLGDTYFGSGTGRASSSLDSSAKQLTNRGFFDCDKVKGVIQSRGDGSGWLQPKQKMLIPERCAIALQEQGWILRNTVIWHKINHMPSSVRDRLAGAYESVYFFVKNSRYYFDLDKIRKAHLQSTHNRLKQDISKQFVVSKAHQLHDNLPMNGGGSRKEIPEILKQMKEHLNPLGANPGDVWHYQGKFEGSKDAESFGSPRARTQRKEPERPHQEGQRWERGKNVWGERFNPLGANPSDVWSLTTEPFKDAHFAVFPQKLVHRILLAACPKEGLVLDPFIGSGTTAVVARKMSLHYIGFDLKPAYVEMARKRLAKFPERLDSFAEVV
jgi:site-specific DNA-methyltransferase (cytosine-N4-specific)